MQEEWTVTDELLALLTEVTSIGVAGQQLRKPIKVPRPGQVQHKQQQRATGDAYQAGIAMLKRTSRGVVRQ
jgi:hypothetical protein